MHFDIKKQIQMCFNFVHLSIKKISERDIIFKTSLVVMSILVAFFIIYITLLRAPSNFPVNKLIEIKKGMSLARVSEYLKKTGVIRSELLFESFVTTFAGDNGAISGEYFFSSSISSWSVAKKITRGDYGLTPIKITIPEGSTIYDIARLFENKFSHFDSVEFLKIVADKEGYLFPDTYLFLPNVKANQVAREMQENFKRKINGIKKEIISFGKPLNDDIIMASILEKEARTTESRRMISGILWKRIDIGMPLQVDAVFPYINGKNTYTLTLKDLKIDSPYNTYKHKGLPIAPISNPGLDAIKAAINPKISKNLYYLSDKFGNIHYATDFSMHKKNRRLYLN